jgi:F0F1-type ATP synthase membrane subunit c/vacuolar-type H+-ATPase subunit K
MKGFMTIGLVLCAVAAGLMAAQTSKSAANDPALQADRVRRDDRHVHDLS